MTSADLDALVARLKNSHVDDVREAAAAIAELRAEVVELTADRDSWEQQTDDRVTDVLEQAKRAERAEAEVTRLTEEEAEAVKYHRQRAERAEARVSDLEVVLHSSRTILGNMAAENKDAIINRWPIKHEPLRADARNLLPLIDKVLYGD
jgi:chromosome segregation ATPase